MLNIVQKSEYELVCDDCGKVCARGMDAVSGKLRCNICRKRCSCENCQGMYICNRTYYRLEFVVCQKCLEIGKEIRDGWDKKHGEFVEFQQKGIQEWRKLAQ